jgi:hypothetical protein
MNNNHNFINKREAVLDSLQTLKTSLLEAIDLGYDDIEDDLYNKLLELVDMASESENIEDLSNVISIAKNIETNLDTFLSSKGVSNLEIFWPSI